MFRKTLKRNKGITLIALIVTIIVLLILAGVSIMMLTGQNGILNRANQAKSETTSKSAEEKVKMAIMTVRAESNDGSLNADKLVEEITNSYKGQAEKSASSDGFPVNITVDGKNFEVNGDGKIATSDTIVDNTGKITLISGTGKDAGDLVRIQSSDNKSEMFNVISYDSSSGNVTALASENIDISSLSVGRSINKNNDNKITKISSRSSSSTSNNLISFSDDSYWAYWDATGDPSGMKVKGDYKPFGDSDYLYVYDENSNIYKYVEAYKEKLGSSVTGARLMAYEEVRNLWQDNSNKKWLSTSNFWLGSAGVYWAENMVVMCIHDGDLGINSGTYNQQYNGIRPVITYNYNDMISKTDSGITAKIISHNDNADINAKNILLSWSELIKVADAIALDSTITSNTASVSVEINGINTTLTVGDKTTVRYNNETKKARIIGFNHDTLADNANKKAGITFEFTEPIEKNVKMNNFRTNVNGWGKSNLRSEMDSTYFEKIEDTVRNAIKTVNKEYSLLSIGDVSGNSNAEVILSPTPSKDKLWLLSGAEITQGEKFSMLKDGNPYKLYALGGDPTNFNVDDYYSFFWTRTPFSANNSSSFVDEEKFEIYGIQIYGEFYTGSGDADTNDYCIAPCFCI